MTETKAVDPVERFQDLLKSFKDASGAYKYREKIQQMAIDGSRALMIDFDDLLSFDSSIADELTRKPDEYLKHLDDAAFNQLKIEDPDYAGSLTKKLYARLRGLPERTPLREIGAEDMGKLVMLDGIIVRSTVVQPLLIKAAYKCRRCDEIVSEEQTGPFMKAPLGCAACNSKGPFDLLEDQSEFINSQQIRVQEKPEDLPPGQLPRTLNVNLIEDLVDVARPGDRVYIIGVVRTVQSLTLRGRGLRTFNLFVDANHMGVVGKEPEVVQISPEDERRIITLSKDPLIHDKITQSIAPSIYGYEDIKRAVMFLLFGGVPKTLPDGIMVRGDINVLIIGDPGTAKSQLLQYVSRIAPRGLYTSGRGTTAAGLTAAVVKDVGGGLSLEAGALVLADKGVCCIDEIDKMRPEDRVAIHEAMEQQTVSIAKGGIVATLNARASILAAANPALGRYDAYRNISENMNLPVTILSRFDLIFIIRDEPELAIDTQMAEHILKLHKSQVSPTEVPLSPDMLRKYISYARRIKPILTDNAIKHIEEFYLEMRSKTDTTASPVAITPRQLEALIRIAEARAKVALHREVTVEDAQAVILLMKRSLSQVGIDVSSGKFDIDVLMTGKPKSLRDKLQAVLSLITAMDKVSGMANENDVYTRLEKDYGIDRTEASRLIGQLQKEGTIYSPRDGFLKRA
jgi:replicative DNA helicase Mcm